MRVSAAGLVLIIAGQLQAKTIRLSPKEDWFAVLNGDGLKPGDVVILEKGVYSDRRLFEMGHAGTEGKPIVIKGVSPAGVVFKRPDAKQNSINLVGAQYLVYFGCNNDKDGKTPGYVFHSIIENNHIHDLKGGTVSQGDGIEIKDGSYGNIIRDNVIHDTNYAFRRGGNPGWKIAKGFKAAE